MKKVSSKRRRVIFSVLFFIISVQLFTTCNKKEETEDCITRTKRDQYFGYEVWAGDLALWGKDDFSNYDPAVYYNIDKHYTLIGSATTTKTFNTGNYKYFVLAARWYCNIDAIQFADGSYYSYGQYTLIGGLAEHPAGGQPAGTTARFLGPPDGINGNLGYKDLCKEPNSFGGFITITKPISMLGGGLTVYIADN